MPNTPIGESPLFHAVLDKVSHLARINRPILIIGERGTGKELIAERLHYLSPRWQQPLVTLNCSTLSEGLIDSELFGHEHGAFTGSKQRHQGRFERAEGGTLFLDELATAPLVVQEKLLRVIEYGQYERVGGSQSLTSDVRVVCATNADLPTLAKQGRFRADLLDRLAFDVVFLPPLRERTADILLLAEHFAMRMCRELSLPFFVGFSQSAQQALLSYAWPGNVRELKNVVERAIYQHGEIDQPIEELIFDPFITPWIREPTVDLSNSDNIDETSHDKIKTNPHINFPIDYRQWQEENERTIVNQALKSAKFNQRHAAELLGLSYHQLRGILRKHAIKATEK